MNVIVSMISVEGKKVYHRPDCVYVKRMKPQNRMSLLESRRWNRDAAAAAAAAACGER